MIVDVMLYGHLRKFGRKFTVDIETPAEALRFLMSQVKGFEAHLRKHEASNFRVVLDGEDSPEKRLQQPLFGVKQIKFIPVVRGAKSDGVQMIVGAALIVASAFIPILAPVGVSMVIGGVAQMLAPNPRLDTSSRSSTGQNGGKYFSGPKNTYGQGACVPVAYGQLRLGGHIISSSSSPETYPKGANGGAFKGGDGLGGSTGDGITTPMVFSIDPK